MTDAVKRHWPEYLMEAAGRAVRQAPSRQRPAMHLPLPVRS